MVTSHGRLLLFAVVLLLTGSAQSRFGWSLRKDTAKDETSAPSIVNSHETTSGVIFDKEATGCHPLLSIDGGGLRGIIVVEVLLVVENAIKKVLRSDKEKYGVSSSGELNIFLADFFTAMSGVGTGSWITTYLATLGGSGASSSVFDQKYIIEHYGTVRPGSVDGLKVMFEVYGQRIYPSFNPEVFKPSRLISLPPSIAGVTCSRHPSAGLDEMLKSFLGESTFSDSKPILFIPAFDLITSATVVFVSGNFRPGENMESYTYVMKPSSTVREPQKEHWIPLSDIETKKKYKLKDVAHGASVAPIIHDAHRFTPINDESMEFYCTDSSLLANNPTLQTIIFLSSNYDNSFSSISVLSIGTGIIGGSLAKQADSGAYQWMLTSSDLFDLVTDGSSELIQAQIDMLYYHVLREGNSIGRGQYLRIQTSADSERREGLALATSDDYSMIQELQKIGVQTAERFRESINQWVTGFVFGIDKSAYKFSSPLQSDPMLYSRAKKEEETEEEWGPPPFTKTLLIPSPMNA